MPNISQTIAAAQDPIALGEDAVETYINSINDARSQIGPMALGLFAARTRWPSDNDFGVWLGDSSYNKIGKTDRAALISLGENWKLVAPVFAMTSPSSSPEIIWGKVKDTVEMMASTLKEAAEATKLATVSDNRNPSSISSPVAGVVSSAQLAAAVFGGVSSSSKVQNAPIPQPGRKPKLGDPEIHKLVVSRFPSGGARKIYNAIANHKRGAALIDRIVKSIQSGDALFTDIGGTTLDLRIAWPYLPQQFNSNFMDEKKDESLDDTIERILNHASVLDQLNAECKARGTYDEKVVRNDKTFTLMNSVAAQRLGVKAWVAFKNKGTWPVDPVPRIQTASRMARKAGWTPPMGVDVDPSEIGLIKVYGRVLFDPETDDHSLFLKIWMVYRFWQECDREWAIGTPEPKNRGLHWVKVCRFIQRFDSQAGYILWEIGTAMSMDPQLENDTVAPMQALRLHKK